MQEKETQMYRTDLWTLWEKARVGCFKRTASKHVYYLGWNRSPAQLGCMRQVLGPGAPGRPRGIGWRGRWEEGPGWGIHVNPWLINFNVWQKPQQCCNYPPTNKNKWKKRKEKLAITASVPHGMGQDGHFASELSGSLNLLSSSHLQQCSLCYL